VAKQSGPSGSITVICGSMFSGKTEELIRLVRRAMHARKRVQVFKSALETRCETTVIRTHDGISFNAVAVRDAAALERLLERDVQVVGIEEVQFFDEAIVGLCQRLAEQGVEVIVAGLDQDFRGLPFTFMPTLMALAENVLKLHAICKVCGGEASRTQRLVDGRPAGWDEPTILIGADERYEARCRRCHKVRNIPANLKPPRNPRETSNRPVAASIGTPLRHERNGTNGHKPVNTTPPESDPAQLEMFPETHPDA
jgi:thymidine kinase